MENLYHHLLLSSFCGFFLSFDCSLARSLVPLLRGVWALSTVSLPYYIICFLNKSKSVEFELRTYNRAVDLHFSARALALKRSRKTVVNAVMPNKNYRRKISQFISFPWLPHTNFMYYLFIHSMPNRTILN